MARQPNFTFKKEPRATGLSAVGHPHQSVAVKLAGKEVGRIAAPYFGTKDGKWGVGLMVAEKASENCSWGWVFFKARFDSEAEAREWLTKGQPTLLERYTLVSPGESPKT